MSDLVTQVGIGGVLAILVLRTVFDYLGKTNEKSNGTIKRPEFDKHKEVVQYKDNCQQIVKRIDEQFRSVKDDLREIKTLIRNGK